MKELSIEEKAKAYDKVLEKAKLMIDDLRKGEDILAVSDLESMFPQLAENEDDVRRRSTIQVLEYARSLDSYNQFGKADIDKNIAWLEKQGMPNPYSGVSFGYNGHTWGMCARDNGVEIIFDGELKASLSSEKSFIYPIHPQKCLAPKFAMEAIKEEKVEPKFKVGDWVVSNLDKKARQISEVHFDEYNSYYVVNGQSVNLEEYDRLHHLWTIEDAKPGDILCTYECDEPKIVFILKGMPKKPYVLSYHCYYNIMYPHFENDSKKGCLAPNDEDVKPATKEQRDTLIKAMADAGWEFDFEKKELKKIEQTLTWSEEDEKMYNVVHDLAWESYKKSSRLDIPTFGIINDWLKSLKERYTWKPSEEQLYFLHWLATNVLTDGEVDKKASEVLESLYQGLKKLKGE